MSRDLGLNIRNGDAVDLALIPLLEIDAFRKAIISEVEGGGRVASLFAHKQENGGARLYAVLADDPKHILSVVTADVREGFQSMTPDCPQVHLFERELFEQLGVMPEGHPWLKPVRGHGFGGEQAGEHPHPLGHSAQSPLPEREEQTAGPTAEGNTLSVGRSADISPVKVETKNRVGYRYFSMTGEEVHEVAVGPVHAGVIEPGHFRFQCTGEIVHHLEIHLGYQHRGVEEAIIGGPHKRTVFEMETVAGDTSIGHGTAYAMALEALGGVIAPRRAQALRAITLELERLANHTGDMGALANDVGFLPTASFCGRLRGDFLNMSSVICGSRLGRGLVRPGGVAFDISESKMLDDLHRRLDWAERDVVEALHGFFSSGSVLDRLKGTGIVSAKAARDLGFVGMAARSTGIAMDVRKDHPTGWQSESSVEIAVATSGDVFARALVRRLEIVESIRYVRANLKALPEGPVKVACPPPKPNMLVIAMTEGWRGEVLHVAITDKHGRFARYKVTDPSFHNWMALALALRGQQISDFPLCNKSFNLSYCGFDL